MFSQSFHLLAVLNIKLLVEYRVQNQNLFFRYPLVAPLPLEGWRLPRRTVKPSQGSTTVPGEGFPPLTREGRTCTTVCMRT